MIKIAIVLYIAIAMAITGTSVAWFVTNNNVEVAPTDDISITADSRVEISMDGEVWGSSLQMTHEITQYADVSGDGIDFWFPRYLSDSDEVDLGNKDAFEHVNTIEPGKSDPYFITLRLKLRSASALDLYLDGSIKDGECVSYVAPKEATKVQGENGTLSYTRPSPLNPELSADYIAAATRVAFVEVVDGVEVLKSVWIPNDKIQVYYDSNGVPRIDMSGEREAYGYLRLNEGQMENYIYSVEDMLSGSVIVGNPQSHEAVKNADGSMTPPVIGMNKPILSFDGSKLEEKELIIRIWIEGTDRESCAALNGGDMLYKFAFTGIVKDVPAEQELTYADRGLFYGNDEATDLVYSLNGIDWFSYSNETLKNAIPEKVNKFYVRKRESVAYQAGTVYCIDREKYAVTALLNDQSQ
jgi:hypothetical protein